MYINLVFKQLKAKIIRTPSTNQAEYSSENFKSSTQLGIQIATKRRNK